MIEKQQFEIDLGTAEKNQAKGRKVLTYVYAINMSKVRSQELDQSGLLAILENVDLAKIERLLLNGSLETARAFIVNSTLPMYSQIEKNIILEVIDNEIFTVNDIEVE